MLKYWELTFKFTGSWYTNLYPAWTTFIFIGFTLLCLLSFAPVFLRGLRSCLKIQYSILELITFCAAASFTLARAYRENVSYVGTFLTMPTLALAYSNNVLVGLCAFLLLCIAFNGLVMASWACRWKGLSSGIRIGLAGAIGFTSGGFGSIFGALNIAGFTIAVTMALGLNTLASGEVKFLSRRRALAKAVSSLPKTNVSRGPPVS